MGCAGVWGLWEEVHGGAPLSWQQHPACSPAVAAAGAGKEPSAFLKTSFVVKSLLFVMCGCRSQLCRGWKLGGSREVAESWQCLSELAPAPALCAMPPACPGFGLCEGSPQHPMQTPEGEALC